MSADDQERFQAALRQHVRDMDDDDFRTFVAETRPPAEALRNAAAQLLSDDAANSFAAFADVSKFVGTDGRIDEARVKSHLAAAYGLRQQSGGNGPGQPPGEAGKEAAERRHGAPRSFAESQSPAAAVGSGPGAAGRAAAARRHTGDS